MYVTSDGLSVTYTIVSGNRAKNAGEYVLTVEGYGNFEGTASVTWTMAKAIPSYTVPEGLVGEYEHTLATIIFPKAGPG